MCLARRSQSRHHLHLSMYHIYLSRHTRSFMPLEDEVLPAKEQPLLAALSPTADSPGYVPKSDPEQDLEEDDEEDPADYPAERGDDGDDEDDSSDDD
ncbi:hypothetical protein Tco_1236790 [Tanacetum coccineum]